jgi:hypothetical protein
VIADFYSFVRGTVMVIISSYRNMEHPPYSIRRILDAVLSGRNHKSPAFQRGFVGTWKRVALAKARSSGVNPGKFGSPMAEQQGTHVVQSNLKNLYKPDELRHETRV